MKKLVARHEGCQRFVYMCSRHSDEVVFNAVRDRTCCVKHCKGLETAPGRHKSADGQEHVRVSVSTFNVR